MDYNLLIVAVLIMLAILDLTVGVANDAVNFLNSAIGSKAAKFRTIMIVAALGVMAGVTLSSGMMEVARKGIFNPEMFLMGELLIIFVAVMFQDVLLLDLFNTLGLPTSTTVSIVFGLFGSSLALAMIKSGFSLADAFMYINSANVIKIVAAILLSIVLAFAVGSFFQYITRWIFTFDYKERFRKYGAYWGGLALTCLTFFIILKGSKGASFMTPDVKEYIMGNLDLIFIYSFIVWTIILLLVQWVSKINILKIIVMVGTFALAMAFAANDLVNFIGAPLAGLNAYELAQEAADPNTADMTDMVKKVKANTWILLFSGFVMVMTLFFSKKARSVASTTIRLSRQEEGFEKFETNILARVIVRGVINIFEFVGRITPQSIKDIYHRRFDKEKYVPDTDEDGDKAAFDLLRASVILMVSAALISIATYFKLPLSTTYVTFIVAMAAALPDRSWGRESAVYRVSGVITVIGGWFFTAFSAAVVSMMIAFLIYYIGIYAVVFLIFLVVFVLYRTRKLHKAREKEIEEEENKHHLEEGTPESMIQNICVEIAAHISKVAGNISNSCSGLGKEDLTILKKCKKKAKKINKNSVFISGEVLKYIKHSSDEELDTSTYYMRTLSSLTEISDRIKNLTGMNYDYVDNNHHQLSLIQMEELRQIDLTFKEFVKNASKAIKNHTPDGFKGINKQNTKLTELINKYKKAQLKRIKKSQANMRRSMLYLNLLNDIEVVANQTNEICMTCKEFIAD